MRGCGLVRSDADAGRLTALGETIVAGSGSEPVLVVADLRTAGSRR
jgi:hypothetical protein